MRLLLIAVFVLMWMMVFMAVGYMIGDIHATRKCIEYQKK